MLRVQHQSNIVTRGDTVLVEPPSLAGSSFGRVAFHGAPERPNGNKDHTCHWQVVLDDPDIHPSIRNPLTLTKNPINFRFFPDLFSLRKGISALFHFPRPGSQRQYFLFSSATVSLARPLALRRLRTRRPPLVLMRARKPNFLFLLTLLG